MSLGSSKYCHLKVHYLISFFKLSCKDAFVLNDSWSNFFKIGIHSMQGWTATSRHGVTRKRSTKKLKHTGNPFRTYSSKMSVNSRLKATKIIGQRKAFYRQKIPESSSEKKETADIDIFVTSRNGDRKIMRSIRITSGPTSRKRK